jgi:hypothetical protein
MTVFPQKYPVFSTYLCIFLNQILIYLSDIVSILYHVDELAHLLLTMMSESLSRIRPLPKKYRGI